MIPFDASDIANWADKLDAEHRLPELIRRLILATVPMPSLLEMPSGSSVHLSGWDGLLVVGQGNAWVPSGDSAWEFSREKNPKSKATEDYTKRTADPKGVAVPNTTFVFVTPRRWGGKRQWVNDRRGEGPWAEVRALDADDLVAWLERAPAVAYWFAYLIGKLPTTGFVPLEEWWERWATMTNPRIAPELVTAGRQDQTERIARWCQGEPSRYYIQGDTREEAIAFLAACTQTTSDPWGAAILLRAIVVQTVDAWGGFEGHSSPLALVRAFSDSNVSSQGAVGRGHLVLTPLDASDDPRGDGCKLPRLGETESVAALTGMGLSEVKARSLGRSTARRLPIIHRQLGDEAGEATPEWASTSTPHSIAALVLVGQWDGSNQGDREIVAQVVGSAYETVEHEVAGLASAADSPFVKVGNMWRFVSHEEAWRIFAPRLTSSDIETFVGVAARIFGTLSPKFELPIEERYMAAIKGKVLPHSGALRQGMARSLGLMGARSDRAKNAEGAPSAPWRIVSSALEGGGDWQIWATLDSDLAALAEASPEALLDAVERDLAATPCPFEELFAQEGDGLLVGAPHNGLLWALERLAWSQDYFARVARVLARLAEIDPGGQTSTKPARTLESLFLPWIRFSETPDERRLETLKMLLDAFPRAGWQLLIGVYPSFHDSIVDRQPPSWRPWAQDGASTPTIGECERFVTELERLLHENAGTDAGRWADLVGIIAELSLEGRQKAIELLSQQSEVLRQHLGAYDLWIKLRGELHHHRSYPDATWAMDEEDLVALEAVYQELTPADPVAAHVRLFDNWPDLPEGQPHEYGEATERIAQARQAAVRTAYQSGGPTAILGIAEGAQEPFQVGIAVALGLDSRPALDLVLEHLGSAKVTLRNLSLGAFKAFFRVSGWKLLEEAIGIVKAGNFTPQALADIYLAAPALAETWQRLEVEDQAVRSAYWQWLQPFAVVSDDPEDKTFAAQRLMGVRRPLAAVALLKYAMIPHEIVLQVLEQIPAEMVRELAAGPATRIDGYDVALLFEKLDQSEDVPDETIARLEVPYIGMLDHHRPNLALHREVVRDPSLFADLISWASSRSDGQAEGVADESERSNRARLVLQGLHRFPGLTKDGAVDADALTAWVNEARRLCKERDRERFGDVYIGQVLANAPPDADGVWPCEPVRDLLDGFWSPPMESGFIIGKHNLRGVTSRSVLSGGGQERALVAKYREDAAKITAKHPFTGKLLREIAAHYDLEAKWHDHQAEWLDQFEA